MICLERKLFSFAICYLLFANCHLSAQVWTNVGNGTNGYGAFALFSFNSYLYAGGIFDSAGSTPAINVAKWDGNTWSNIGLGIGGFVGANVLSFTDFNGDLIAGGTFDSAGGNAAYNIAKWNGINWTPLGTGSSGSLYSLATYNGELWNSSDADTCNGMGCYHAPAQWNGSQWSCYGTSNGTVNTIREYNGDLYLGGAFTIIYPPWITVNRIVKWNGVSWLAVDTGLNAPVYCLAVYNGELYAGGQFTYSGLQQTNHIAKWNGISWSPVGTGMNKTVNSLTVFNGELYAGGAFDSVGNIAASRVAKWDGISWSPIDTGFNNAVMTLDVYNGELYAGGFFTMSGNTPLAHIAKLDTSAITGNNLIENDSKEISVFPNPAKDIFIIKAVKEIKNARIEIMNAPGEKIYCETVNLKSKTIKCKLFSPGIYYLIIFNDKGNYWKKLIVE